MNYKVITDSLKNRKSIRKKSLFTAVAVGLGLTASLMAQVPSYVPTNGLVGWWPFSGNANDESGNGNNGTVNGATLTSDRFGNAGKAYLFYQTNGGGDIQLPSITMNNSFSISCWVNLNTFTSGNVSTIISSYPGSGIGWELNIDHSNLAPGGRGIYGLLGPEGIPENSVISNYAFGINNWGHIVWTKQNNLSNIYLNGSLIYQTSTANPINNSFGNTFFGHSQWGGNPFYGKIDDTGIWNRALTQQEISALYNGCGNVISTQPTNANSNVGTNVQFTVGAASGSTYQWQSNPLSLGWQNVPANSTYSGGTTNTLTVNNVQLFNHNQPFRVIASLGNCTDTSNIATIQIADTCITTVYDTVLTTVTDTLIINTTLSLPAPNNENTIKVYPNPTSDHITIDNGNFAAMAGYSIKIENNAGQQVFQSAINQAQFYVDLSTWTGNGLYFVHLIDPQNNTLTIRKIVLQ